MRITAFVAVGGALVAVGGLFIVSVAASQLQQGGMAVVVASCWLIPFGAFIVASALLRPATLTVDDGGLHLRMLTRVRVIPWSLVRSFRTRPGGGGKTWFVQAELGTGKKVVLGGCQGSLDRASRIAAELTAAYREHLAQRPSL